MKKKLISTIILIVVFSLLLQVPALAAPPSSPAGLSSEHYDQIYTGLDMLYQNASHFSLSRTWDALKIGNPIHSYTYTSAGLSENNFIIYPIFSSNTIPFLAIQVKLDDGTYVMQLAENSLPELYTYINEDIAIVYDSVKRHIVSNGSILSSTIIPFPENTFTTALTSTQLEDLLSATTISYSNSDSIYDLNYTPSQIATRNPYISLSVPIKLQTRDKICWAACTASIAQALTGTSYLDYVIAQEVAPPGTSFNVLKQLYEIEDILTTYARVVYYSQELVPTQQKIYTNLNYGYPVLGSFNNTVTGSGHAVVINAIYLSSHVSLMDPAQGFIIGTITVNTNGSVEYRYTNASSGSQYKLFGYCAVY